MENNETLILNTADRTILRSLYTLRGTPLSLFQLHKELGFSPAQLGSFVSKFVEIGIVDLRDEAIMLTKFGRKWLVAHRMKIFYSRVLYDWRDIPKEMQKQKPTKDMDTLYLPNKRSLGEHFLEDTMA
jgi:hypothetical protein